MPKRQLNYPLNIKTLKRLSDSQYYYSKLHAPLISKKEFDPHSKNSKRYNTLNTKTALRHCKD